MKSYTIIAHKSRGIDPGEFVACEICGQKAVNVHHIEGRLGENLNDPYNLLFVCYDCHNKIHTQYKNDTAYKKKLKKIALYHIENRI